MAFTTGTGLNFYRGNNKFDIGVWGDSEVFEKIKTFEGEHFESRMNDFYTEEALNFIKSDPSKFVVNVFRKFYSFWGISFNKNPLQLFYQLSWLIILLLFIYGTLKTFSWKQYKFYYLFFISSTLIVLIFFPLPRYQTMMKFLMFPFCAYAVVQLLDKFKKEISGFIK